MMRRTQDKQQKHLEVESSQDLHVGATISYYISLFFHGSLSMQNWSRRDVHDKTFVGISTNIELISKQRDRNMRVLTAVGVEHGLSYNGTVKQ